MQLLLLELFVLGHTGDQDPGACFPLVTGLLQYLAEPVGGHVLFDQVCRFSGRAGNLEALLHQDQDDPLKTNRETAGRYITACKSADHLVITAAATAADAQLRHGNLENCSCIVGHAPDDGGVEDHTEVR